MSKRIESQIVNVNCPQSRVFDFVCNFDHFSQFLPDQVANWKSEGDFCTFEIIGLTTLGLRIIETQPFSCVKMKGEGRIPFDFMLSVNITEIDKDNCRVYVAADTKMNPLMVMLAEKPLTNFADDLVKKLKNVMENQV